MWSKSNKTFLCCWKGCFYPSRNPAAWTKKIATPIFPSRMRADWVLLPGPVGNAAAMCEETNTPELLTLAVTSSREARLRSGTFAENTLKQREQKMYINTMSEVTVSSVAEDECSFCAHSLSQLPYCVIHKKRNPTHEVWIRQSIDI